MKQDIIQEQKPKGLREQISELNERLDMLKDTKGKRKDFKLPYKVRAAMKKAAQKRKILIFQLGADREIRTTVGEIKHGMVLVNGQVHNASTDFVYMYKKTPTLVIPEWSLNPIGTEDYYDAVENKSTIEAQTVILRAIEMKEAGGFKTKVSGKMLIYIVIGAAILGYVIFGKG